MLIKYIRVSSISQNTDRQETDLNKYDMIFTDKCSGKDRNRPELQKMMIAIRQNDQVFCHSLDRLGRSTVETLSIIEDIIKKGATITFIKEGLTFNGSENPLQKLMLTIFAAVAQAERELIKERQKEGIEQAKKKGKYKKAHPTKKNHVEINQIKYDRECGMTEKELMNKYHISKPTLYRYLKR